MRKTTDKHNKCLFHIEEYRQAGLKKDLGSELIWFAADVQRDSDRIWLSSCAHHMSRLVCDKGLPHRRPK